MSDDVVSRTQSYDVGQDRELHTSQRLHVADGRITSRIGPIGELEQGVVLISTDKGVVRFHRKVVAAMRRYGRRHDQVKPDWKVDSPAVAPVVCPACLGSREVWRGSEEKGRLVPCPLCAGDAN